MLAIGIAIGGAVAGLGIYVWTWVSNIKQKLAMVEEDNTTLKDENTKWWQWSKDYEQAYELLLKDYSTLVDEKTKWVQEQKEAELQLQSAIDEIVKRRKTAPAAAPVASSDPNMADSVKARLRKAVEITTRQSKIDLRKGPDYVTENNELELEKLQVLKSILADGFDPVITITFSTGNHDMLLSKYIAHIERGLA